VHEDGIRAVIHQSAVSLFGFLKFVLRLVKIRQIEKGNHGASYPVGVSIHKGRGRVQQPRGSSILKANSQGHRTLNFACADTHHLRIFVDWQQGSIFAHRGRFPIRHMRARDFVEAHAKDALGFGVRCAHGAVSIHLHNTARHGLQQAPIDFLRSAKFIHRRPERRAVIADGLCRVFGAMRFRAGLADARRLMRHASLALWPQTPIPRLPV
jgi:hypothetical protein